MKSSNLEKTGFGKNKRTIPVVKYHIKVEGALHKGHRICVEGYPKKFFESAWAVSGRYVAEQPVKVFYDPRNPASAVLVTGTTPSLWSQVLLLVLLGRVIGYGSYGKLSFANWKAVSEVITARPFVQRASAFFTLRMIVLFYGLLNHEIAVATTMRQNRHLPRDLAECFILIFIEFMFALSLRSLWVACSYIYGSFTPAAEVSDLRADPGAPRYSNDSPHGITCTELVFLQRTPFAGVLLEASLRKRPYPHYKPVPDRPNLIYRIKEDGTETVGRFVGREFKANGVDR